MRTASAAGVLATFVLLQAISREAGAWPIVVSRKPSHAPVHRVGLVAGVGSEPGFALGAQWISPVLGLQVLGGYQPTWEALNDNWFKIPTGFRFRSGHVVAADLLVPVLRHGDTLFGIQAGYRYSSLLGEGGSGAAFVHMQLSRWLAFGASAGASQYEGGCCWHVPLLSVGGNSDSGVVAFGGEVTLALLWPRVPKARTPE